MPKIFHCADIHLDSPFSLSSPRGAERRRTELRAAFTSALMFARDRKADIFIISGDLFDGEYVTRDTREFITRELAKLAPMPVFIAPGNHDPFTAGSPFEALSKLQNVHVFGAARERVELPELGTDIYGVGFTSRYMLSSPVAGWETADPSRVNILVCHGDMTSASSQTAPITEAEIAASGFDYIALGHIHKRCEPQKIGDTIFAYCGIPEGRGFDECGNLGCYIGHTEDSITTVHFHRTCVKRLFDIKLDISSAEDTFHIYETAIQEMQNIGSANDLYRITLCGRTNIDDINCSVIKTRLCDYGILTDVIDETKPKYEPDDFSDDAGICGEVVGMTDNMMSLSESGDSSAKESLNSFLCRYTQGRVGLSDLDAELLKNAELIGLAALLGGD